MELAARYIVENALQIVYPLEVASAAIRPGEGTDTMLNCSCAFLNYSGRSNIEFTHFLSKKTLCKFA